MFATALQLAKAAGLPVKAGKNEMPKSEYEALSRWFSSHAAGVLETHFTLHQEAIESLESEKEEQYSTRRKERYNKAAVAKYDGRSWGFKTQDICGKKVKRMRVEPSEPGLYKWTMAGKLNQSWLGQRDKALLSPKQIGGYLAGRYPGHDITVQYVQHMNSSMFIDKSIMQPLVVPCYQVFIHKKMPGWYMTAERLLLEGRLLDRESAKAHWDDYQEGKLSQQKYAEKLARLCREAEKFDEPPTGWIELDGSEMVYDDTRDGVEVEETLGMLYNRGKHDDDAVIFPSVCIKPTLYQWDEADERLENVEDDRMVEAMLGLQEHQIEEAEEVTTHFNEFTREARFIRRISKAREEEVTGW